MSLEPSFGLCLVLNEVIFVDRRVHDVILVLDRQNILAIVPPANVASPINVSVRKSAIEASGLAVCPPRVCFSSFNSRDAARALESVDGHCPASFKHLVSFHSEEQRTAAAKDAANRDRGN
jgi:hypothetical protein